MSTTSGHKKLEVSADDPCHYSVLGVAKTANTKEIKAAFYESCKQYHPDMVDGKDNAAKFARIQAAYETLANPISRNNFDRAGSAPKYPNRMPGMPKRGNATAYQNGFGRAPYPGQPYPGQVKPGQAKAIRNTMTVVMIVAVCVPVYMVSRALKNRLKETQRLGFRGRRPGQHFSNDPVASQPKSNK